MWWVTDHVSFEESLVSTWALESRHTAYYQFQAISLLLLAILVWQWSLFSLLCIHVWMYFYHDFFDLCWIWWSENTENKEEAILFMHLAPSYLLSFILPCVIGNQFSKFSGSILCFWHGNSFVFNSFYHDEPCMALSTENLVDFTILLAGLSVKMIWGVCSVHWDQQI